MQSENFKTNVAKNLVWKYAERITAQAVSLIVSIILARLLSPYEFGAVSLAMVFITIANVFVSSGFGNALIQKKDADEIDFSTVFYIGLALSIIIYFIIFFISPYISDFYGLPIICPVLRALGLRLIIASVNSVQHAYVSRKLQFRLFFWSTLIGTIISCFVGIYLAYSGFGVWALVAQYLVNSFVDTVVLFITIDWRPIFVFSLMRAKKLFDYGSKLLFSELLNTFYSQLSNLLISRFYTIDDLSYYSQGDRYPNTIVRNISVTIQAVLFPAISIYQNNIIKVKNITRRAIQVSSYIMWPMMIGFAVCAKQFVIIFLTEKWLPIVPYIRIFCIIYAFHPINSANIQAISAIGRSDIYLKLEIIKKIIGLAFLAVSIRISPLFMAISLIPQCLLSTYINAFPNKKLLNYSYIEQIYDVLPSVIISLIMGLIVNCVNYLHLSIVVTLITQIIVGVSIYLLISILTKQEGYIYIMSIIKGDNNNVK